MEIKASLLYLQRKLYVELFQHYLTYLFINRLEKNCFVHDIKFNGVNFPSDGPAVMKKATHGWEPSTEKMYERDGVLKGAVTMALKVGNGHYMCDYKTTYK